MRGEPARRPTVRRTFASAIAVVGLALPLAACSTGEANGTGLVRAGCPADIRIQTDDLPRVEWGFLYGLLDDDQLEFGDASVSAPLLIDGRPSGSRLTILLGDPDDGASASADLHADPSILLGAVDTDAALLDYRRNPTVGVFAPLLRNPRIAYWDASVYPDADGIARFNGRFLPDGSALVPVVTPAGDPFAGYAVGKRILVADQLSSEVVPSVQTFAEGGGIGVFTGDALTDPYRLAVPTGWGSPVESFLLEDTGYRSDANVLSARPQALLRYSDCLDLLVPVLQQALVDYLADPEATTQLLVALSARFGDETYDAILAAAALEVLESDDFVGNGLDDTIGDLDIGRVRQLFDDAVPAWELAEVRVPRGVSLEAIVSNRFIDPSIGR